MSEVNQSLYGESKESINDKHGNKVGLGDLVRVLAVDDRILDSLPDDEIEALNAFIGSVFPIVHINRDGSAVVEKELRCGDEVMGHCLAVFPDQFEACQSGT